MKYLFVSILAVTFLFFTLDEGTGFVPQKSNYVINPEDSTGLYGFTIQILKNEMNGLLFFKKQNDSTFRTILLSEMGPKILDLEITPLSYSTNFVFKQLDNKTILTSLSNDFGYVSGLAIYNTKYTITIDSLVTSFDYQLQAKRSIRYNFENNNDTIVKATVYNDNKEAEELVFYYNSALNQLDSVEIQHLHFDMKMSLRKINR